MRPIVTTLGLTLLAACGGAQSAAPATPATPTEPTPSVVGRWLSSCMPTGQGTFFKLDFNNTDRAWTLDYVVHGDEACTVKLATVHIEGPYEIGAKSAVVEGAYEGMFGFASKTITPHAQPIVDALGQMGCGAEPWAIDVAQDVTEKGCPGFGQHPKAECPADYDILQVSGTTLTFGKRPADNDMCTPDKRPTELSTVSMIKQ